MLDRGGHRTSRRPPDEASVAVSVRNADWSAPAPTFTDVDEHHPFRGEIEWLASTSITTGYPNGTYQPSRNITRQAMAADLHRIHDGPSVHL